TRLVRGLDYYNNIVFEYKTLDDEFGSVGGGGRYDNLSESLDGPSIPSVGFAFGLDRLVDVMNRDNIEVADNNIDLYIMNVTKNELMYSYNLAQDLRMCGFKVDIDLLNKSMKAKFKEVDRLNPKYLIIIGEEEVKSGILTIKDNLTKEEQKIESTELLDFLNVNL
ncbi:MAG: ATP phosphoribosyltransferase regulatory subunit, partial [Bacilli bacterium]|nr:ATP phosphoribosyltransferase regulatory subunit [Bacilli bacterium]